MVRSVKTRIIAALAPLLLVLAGCVGGEPKSTTPASATPMEDSGLVTGSVLDTESRPLEGADVGIRGTNLVDKADATGAFQFVDVKPGKYVLDVAKLGYSPLAREIEVKAGQETSVELQLPAIVIAAAAYYEAHPFTGMLECSLGTAAWVSPCSYPYTAAYYTLKDHGVQPPTPDDLQPNKWRYNFTVEPGAVEVVSEMVWTPSSAAAQTMMIVLSCAQYDPVLDDCDPQYASKDGPSPLRVAWKANQLKPPQWVMSRTYLPFEGAQVAFQQKFEVWNSVWYNGAPPEGWSILTEGQS